MKRNGEIDILRFIFAILIVVHHYAVNWNLKICTHAGIGVEYFFLVAGFFMAQTAFRTNNNISVKEIPNETWRYIIRKIGGLFKYYLCAFFLNLFIRNIIIRKQGIKIIVSNLIKSIPTITLTFMGINNNYRTLYVGNTWFLSAMFIAMFLLFPLLLRWFEYTTKLVLPIFALFILGYIYGNYQTILVHDEWNGLFYTGFSRAIAEMSLGASLFPLSQFLSAKVNARIDRHRIFGTVLKWMCFVIVICYAIGLNYGKYSTIHVLLWCAFGLLLIVSDVGYSIPGCKITDWLGKVSMPIFMFHGVIRLACKDIIPESRITTGVFIILVIGSIVLSILLYYFVNYLTRCYEKRMGCGGGVIDLIYVSVINV